MNLWILNHYAGNQYFDKGGRHYSFAKYLVKAGYHPTVFCSNAVHFGQGYFFQSNRVCHRHLAGDIHVPFIFVKCRSYEGNGKDRILNMADFYHNVKIAARKYADKKGRPDIIFASSVHPLTLVAGIQLAKYYKVKCLCEVRDLWPESIVAYSDRWKRDDWLIKLLYRGEKWIYKKADAVIMSWPGGYDYICERGWNREIPKSKIAYISNGIDLEAYRKNDLENVADADLLNEEKVKFIYTGALGHVNNFGMILDAAEILQKRGNHRALFFVYGDGEEYNSLKVAAEQKKLTNIRFKGRISKNRIPAVLRYADVTLLHNSSTELNRFGQSQNKFFEYLAAGKPILMTYSVKYSIVQSKGCGLEVRKQTPENIADAVDFFCTVEKNTYRQFCENARKLAETYDFARLTGKLCRIIEQISVQT